MNRTTFFAYVRRAPFGGRLQQSQIDGMNAIINKFFRLGLDDLRWLAYILATAFHETGARMLPVREGFAASDAQAKARLEAAWQAGNLKSVKTPYWRDGWFGRGHVQLTHQRNYAAMGKILGIDLVGNPSLALDLETSVLILIEGMTSGNSGRGDFTGKSLEQFFNDAKDDPVGARAIVNGSDKAKLIAGYHRNFLDALEAAQEPAALADAAPEEAKADDVPAGKSGSLWTIATGAAGSAGVSLITGITNPWALAGLGMLLVAGGVLGWLVWSGRITINRAKAAG